MFLFVQSMSTLSLSVRDTMTVEEVLWNACVKKQIAPNDHFLRCKKRREAEEYYVPPRGELIENILNVRFVLNSLINFKEKH